MAEHHEPYELRGSRTVLRAPGGEIPPGDSTTPAYKHPLILRPHLEVKRKERVAGRLSEVDQTFRAPLETDAISQKRTLGPLPTGQCDTLFLTGLNGVESKRNE